MDKGLYLITTPIGNIEDITLRAKNALTQIDMIFCEDTRNFKKLANLLGISLSSKTVLSFHDHSDAKQVEKVIKEASQRACAFVSDAGSPLISDPGLPLIQKALNSDISIFSLSGISSVITALELSGLPAIPFHFHGFLARDHGKKHKDFQMIGNVYGTHIFFEGVSRVLKTLEELCQLYPDFDFAIARELTKEYESVYRFKGKDFSEMRDHIVEKGEFVLLVNNSNKNEMRSSADIQDLAHKIISEGVKPKILSKLLSEITGLSNKEIYKNLNSKE